MTAETQLIPTTRQRRTFEVLVEDRSDTVDVLGIEIPREPEPEQVEFSKFEAILFGSECLRLSEAINEAIHSLQTLKANYQVNMLAFVKNFEAIEQEYDLNQQELLRQQNIYGEADSNHEVARERFITFKLQMEAVENEIRKHFEALKTTEQNGDEYIEAMKILINDPMFKKLSADLRLARDTYDLKKSILESETEKLEELLQQRQQIISNLQELVAKAQSYVADTVKHSRKINRGSRLIRNETWRQRVGGFVSDLGRTATSGGGLTTPTLMMRESMMLGITQGTETDA